jgi:hypothetical protein
MKLRNDKTSRTTEMTFMLLRSSWLVRGWACGCGARESNFVTLGLAGLCLWQAVRTVR